MHNLLCILVPFSIMMWQFQKTFIMVNLWEYSKRVSGVLRNPVSFVLKAREAERRLKNIQLFSNDDLRSVKTTR